MLVVERIARSYWEAEESRDVDRILEHFLPDAAWTGRDRAVVGHAEIPRFYEEMPAAYPGPQIRVLSVHGK